MTPEEVRTKSAIVIETLRRMGDELSRPREVDHFFIGDGDVLELVAHRLEGDGFRVVDLTDDSLHLKETRALVGWEMNALTDRLCDLAASLGVVYDGWGAPMAVPPRSLLARLLGFFRRPTPVAA